MAAWLAESGFDNAGWWILAALVVAGYFAVYAFTQRATRRMIAELRAEFEQRANAILAAVKQQSAPVEKTAPVAAVVAPAAPPPVVTKPVPPPKKEEVSPEMLLVIAAAVTAYMGKKVRIRSAKIVYSQESFNPWSQQGRVFVQASHNLTQRY